MHTFARLEQRKHGTSEYPGEYYYVDIHHPRYQLPSHWHNEWELLHIIEGTFMIYIDNEQFSAKTGDVLLIRGGSLHGGAPHNCVYECFCFDLYGFFRSLDMVKKHIRPFYRQTVIPQCLFPKGENADISKTVADLMAIFRNDRTQSFKELETISSLSKLFSQILKEGLYTPIDESEYTARAGIDHIKTVLEYIEENYNTCLTLEKLAKVANMNPKYFCRVFSSITHQSPMEYVNFYRIEKSAYLLDSTDLTITEIALDCGFSESSYFTKVFKKYKGSTPRQYRHPA